MARTVAKVEGLNIHRPVMLAVHEIAPAPYNPNKMSPKKFAALKALIQEVGFAEPIIVQKGTLMLIAGHHRIKALKELCVELAISVPEIPATVLDVTDRTAKRLNIAFNKVHGEPDARLLGELLVSINEEETLTVEDQEIIGFDEPEEFDKYIRLIEPDRFDDEPVPPRTFGRSVTLSLDFKSVEMRDAVKRVLVEKAETSKKTTGEFIADLLGCKATKGKSKKRAA